MPAVIMDGKGLAAKLRQDIALNVDKLKSRGISPGLAVILVGNDPASRIYVSHRKKTASSAA
jgi:methylenetetrahydrofolate dehydrogenase (NADP+)/methenyltetrahydrofolate cyclohydrolase